MHWMLVSFKNKSGPPGTKCLPGCWKGRIVRQGVTIAETQIVLFRFVDRTTNAISKCLVVLKRFITTVFLTAPFTMKAPKHNVNKQEILTTKEEKNILQDM